MKKRNKKFWKQVDRYIETIEEEIRQPEPDFICIDFYLFKIRRRFDILKNYLDEKKN